MAKRKNLKCPKCDRKFSMPAGLALHVASHSKKKKKKKKAFAKRKRAGGKKIARRGRPKGSRSKFNLSKMSLEGLTALISDARQEARNRIAELEAAID